MRKANKFKEMLWNKGITLNQGGVYWLNGDAELSASQRNKLRKVLGWIANLPQYLKEEFNYECDLVIRSSFFVQGYEELFGLYGSNTKDGEDIFAIEIVVNDYDESGDYIHHWEGMKKWLASIDANHLNSYLEGLFLPVRVSHLEGGEVEVSHEETLCGIDEVVEEIHHELEKNDLREWWFPQYYSGRNLLGVIKTPNKEKFFWGGGFPELKTLEIEFSRDGKTISNYVWGSTPYGSATKADITTLWVWDDPQQKYLKLGEFEF